MTKYDKYIKRLKLEIRMIELQQEMELIKIEIEGLKDDDQI